MSTNSFFVFRSNLSVRLSSSSSSRFMYGVTPTTGICTFSSSISMPGSRIVLSPRNLLMIIPFTLFCSSSVSRIMVPVSCAKTPPRSMSPTRSTGALTSSAIPMLTISSCFRLISAGLPAPSMTMISLSLLKASNAFWISGTSVLLYAKYSLALILPRTFPFTITCEPVSLEGFKRIGFIQTDGSIPAASACIT